jgi:hypothetical protein
VDLLRYVHPANEPLLIAGVGTYGMEIAEDLPDADAIFVKSRLLSDSDLLTRHLAKAPSQENTNSLPTDLISMRPEIAFISLTIFWKSVVGIRIIVG